jgi:hypothetical protein
MNDLQNADLTTTPTPREDDALQFELSGYRIGWRPSGLALERAADQGVELGQILRDVSDLHALTQAEEENGEWTDEELRELNLTAARIMTMVARIVWLGGLHFEKDFSYEAVLSLLDWDAIEALPLAAMVERMIPRLEDEAGDVDTAGKAPGPSPTS